MTKLVCKGCGYHIDSQKPTKTCPYCGKDRLEKEKNAGEILEEINDIL